jgi:sodium/bile acid cotransporter 7
MSQVILMTVSSGGDEAAAIFNAAFGNFIGIFITPMWVLVLLGKESNIEFLDVVLKLIYKVVVPLAVGQFAQFHLPSVKAFATKHKKRLKAVQEFCLIFIVYTVFCVTFEAGTEASAQDIATMAGVQVTLLIVAKSVAWVYMGLLFPDEPELRVMGLFGSLLCELSLV